MSEKKATNIAVPDAVTEEQKKITDTAQRIKAILDETGFELVTEHVVSLRPKGLLPAGMPTQPNAEKKETQSNS